jgi:hypothetical protein
MTVADHTRNEVSREIFAFIEGFYNRQRLHQSLAYLSPPELSLSPFLPPNPGVHQAWASSAYSLFSACCHSNAWAKGSAGSLVLCPTVC